MRVYLNAGFGDPIGQATLDLIAGLGFAGIRQDVKDINRVRQLVAEFESTPLTPLFVIDYGVYTAELAQAVVGVASASLPDYAVEIGNELNIDYPGRLRVDAKVYSRAFAEIEAACYRIDSLCKVVTAGISNCGTQYVGWAETAISLASKQAIMGFHTYRPDSSPSPNTPQSGYRNRADEFAALTKAAGGRRMWNTEVGWHTADRKKGCFGKFRLTDDQCLGYLILETQLNRAFGSGIMGVYQLNDGPTNTAIDRYGIRDAAGALKPQSQVGHTV